MAGVILLGTEPRVGKTYASILLLQELLRLGQNPAYFKFAATGIASLERSEAAVVQASCRLDQNLNDMIPYYCTASGPVHLAARRAMHFINERAITERFAWSLATHSHIVVEGVGEVVSPLIMERDQVLLQEDLIFKLQLKVILVVRMSAAALNNSVLAVNYLKSISKSPCGIIINAFNEHNYAHLDSLDLIERCTQTPVLATIGKNSERMNLRCNLLYTLALPDDEEALSEAPE